VPSIQANGLEVGYDVRGAGTVFRRRGKEK